MKGNPYMDRAIVDKDYESDPIDLSEIKPIQPIIKHQPVMNMPPKNIKLNYYALMNTWALDEITRSQLEIYTLKHMSAYELAMLLKSEVRHGSAAIIINDGHAFYPIYQNCNRSIIISDGKTARTVNKTYLLSFRKLNEIKVVIIQPLQDKNYRAGNLFNTKA